MNVPSKYGYATQLLSEKQVKIFQGSQPILDKVHVRKYENIKPQSAIIYTIKEAINPERDLTKIPYKELHNYGYVICARTKRFVNEDGKIMNTEYFLSKRGKRLHQYGAIPPNHQVVMDRNDYLVRIEGTNVPGYIGQWQEISAFHTEAEHYKPRKTESEDFMQKIREKSEANFNRFTKRENLQRMIIKMEIPDIPIILTDDSGIICIPKETDPPTIGCVGMRGEGKTFALHGILGRMHSIWNTCNVIMNDLTGETLRWSKPWELDQYGNKTLFTYEQIKKLKYLGMEPQPLAMVFLHPEKNPPLTDEETTHMFDVGVKISLPFKQFIQDIDLSVRGNPVWEMKKSGRWLRSIIKQLPEDAYTHDFQTFMLHVRDYFSQLREEGNPAPEGVQSKITSILEDIYNANFLDVSNGIPSLWTAKSDFETITDYPWVILMRYGIIPSIITNHIYNKSWFPQYYKLINETILSTQLKNPLFKEKTIMEYIPEITGITRKDSPTSASETLEKTFAEGRNMRVGAVYDTQNYELLPDKVRTNTQYLLVFRQKGKNLDAIRHDFTDVGSRTSWNNEIMHLQPLECVALTTKHFIKYAKNGEKEKISMPVRGTIIPPTSCHSSPGDKI